MPKIINKPLVPQNNGAIIGAIWKNASPDFQRRVPEPTKANLKRTIEALTSSSNKPAMNEFVDSLVNRIGQVIFRQNSWSNPLAKFKRGQLEYGDTIEEIMVGLVQAQSYDVNRESLEQDVFGQNRPDVQVNYHTVNRQDKYKVTVNDAELRKAFLDEFGLYSFTAQLMASASKSDQWDEFLLMSRLFRENYDNNGFFKVNIPDLSNADSDSADAKYGLRRLREFTGNLQFISTHYNAAGMPTSANPDELELFITPEANAAFDVEALAGAFNVGLADVESRKTLIPEEHFNIPGAQAVLTTRDFFVAADQLFQTTSIYNPDGLYSNYWTHHWEVISLSRFVPAILFTTEPSTPINLDVFPVTGLDVPTVVDQTGAVQTAVERGGVYQVSGLAQTEGDNNAVIVSLVGDYAPQTVVTQQGVLYVSIEEVATNIVVQLRAVDNLDIQPTTVTLPIHGDRAQLWPDPQVFPDSDDDGLLEVTPDAVPAAPTSGANKNKVTIPDADGVLYKDGSTVVNGETLTLTANKTITATPETGYEFTAGATTSWTLTYTA